MDFKKAIIMSSLLFCSGELVAETSINGGSGSDEFKRGTGNEIQMGNEILEDQSDDLRGGSGNDEIESGARNDDGFFNGSGSGIGSSEGKKGVRKNQEGSSGSKKSRRR